MKRRLFGAFLFSMEGIGLRLGLQFGGDGEE